MTNLCARSDSQHRPVLLGKYSQNSVSGLWTTLSELESSLNTSRRYEQQLHLNLLEQSDKTNHLQELLDKERSRNERLLAVMKGVDSSSESSPRTTGSSNNIANDRYSLDTISPVLMQYRYDELALSHRRCLKLLCTKEKLLKKTLADKEEIQSRFDELVVQHKELQKKTEILCCKYFNLQAKKTEEALALRELFTYAVKCLKCNCKKSLAQSINKDSGNEDSSLDLILLPQIMKIFENEYKWN